MTVDDTPDDPTQIAGPRLLEERSIAGILVHLVSIPLFGVPAGVLYLASADEFTRDNAKNALDWNLFLVATVSVTVVVVGGTSLLQDVFAVEIGPIAGIVIMALFGCLQLLFLWTIVVGVIATGKAIFGSAWRYPFAPPVSDLIGPRLGLAGRWSTVVFVYALVTPLVLGAIVLGIDDGIGFFVTFFGLAGLIVVLAPLTVLALYEEGKQASTDGHRSIVVTIGLPVVTAIVGYALSIGLGESPNPSGDAVYLFLVTLWLTATGYCVYDRLS